MTSVLRQAGTQALGSIHKELTVTEIEARIRAEVWKKQIRMKTFFEDYDKLRKGYCIQDKFISGLSTALNILSIHLTKNQIKTLSDKYRMEPGDLIHHSDFVNSIDQQFSDYEMAQTNLSNLKINKATSEKDDETLHQLLLYIKWLISSKRIFIKRLFQDYDRTKSCYITREQFIRVLDNLALVKNQELADLLCRKYSRSVNSKQVSYVDFIADVENIKETQSFVVKGIVENQKAINPMANIIQDINRDSLTDQFYIEKKMPEKNLPIYDILKKIQALVTLKRLRIRQFFLDFDGLRKNIVTGEQFKRVLGMLGLSFTQKEFNQILSNYRVDPQSVRGERIRWMDFCEDIDTVFTTKGLDKDPLYRVSQIDKSVFEPVKHIEIQFTPEESDLINDLILNYQTAISHKRVHLKPLFQDFDITKIGYVTKNQFTRILKQFDFVPKNQQQFNLLLKKYMDRGNLNEVNYYQFINDVDLYSEEAKQMSSSYANTFKDYKYQPRGNKAYIKNEQPDDLEDLLNRIRGKVKEERIRVAEFMKDFDKLRHGNITKDQFRLCLNMAKLPLSDRQFNLILDYFECADKANYVRWKQFCDILDEVFNIKELEKVPPNQKVELAQTKYHYGRSQITQEQLNTANRIKKAFTEYQLANRLDTKQLFENWDKLSRFKVSSKQFRQVLATVGFNLTEQENRCICKNYLTDDEKEVKYLQFLKDTKPYDFSYMTEIKQTFKKGTGQKRKLPQTIEQILLELRRTTKINRLRYREYFKDYDPLNKGTVKINKFKSVLYQTMKIPLQQSLLNILQRHYVVPNDPTVLNYHIFCEDLDLVFNLPDKQKDPLIKPYNFDYTIVHLKKQEIDIDSLMKRLGEVTRKHRLLMKPFFQDKDIAKIGRVSFTRMRSILDNNKIPLTDYQYSLLCHNYASESGDSGEFNYVDFIEALKQYEAEN